jgi:hypothetical protein
MMTQNKRINRKPKPVSFVGRAPAVVRALLVILAIYVQWELPLSGKIRIPHFFGFLLACTFLADFSRWRRCWPAVLACLGFILFNVLSSSLTSSVGLAARIGPCVYFFYLFGISAFISTGAFVSEVNREWAANIILGFCFFILAFASLEQRTFLREVSDRGRIALYGGLSYESDDRDMEMVGRIRPKAFNSEPSFASRGVCELAILAALLSRRRWTRVSAVLCPFACLIIFASPAGAGYVVCALVGLFVLKRFQSPRGLLVYYGLAGLVSLLVFGLLLTTVPFLKERFIQNRSSDLSTYMRTVFLREMAGKALEINPASGVGLGGEERLSSQFNVPTMEAQPIKNLINNAMWSIPFFTGLAGCLLFAWVLWICIWRVVPQRRMIFLSCIIMSLNVNGSISSASTWLLGGIMFSILTGKFQEVSRRNSRAEELRWRQA